MSGYFGAWIHIEILYGNQKTYPNRFMINYYCILGVHVLEALHIAYYVSRAVSSSSIEFLLKSTKIDTQNTDYYSIKLVN